MKQKNCSNDEFFIVLKSPEDTSWQLSIDRLNTPTTITFAVSTVEPQTVIKKIIWDLGNGNQHKSFTNRKQDLNEHTINCKYRKAHNTTISVQASVYTETGFAVTPPLVASTSNREIKEYYVEPEDFKNQIMLYYKTDNFTDDVADSIYKIANRLAFAPNFINYTYREEMVGDAVERMVQALTDQKFDPLKGNPFSYFTKIAFHAFCNRIKKEKKGRDALVNYQNEVYNNIGSNHGVPCSSDGTQMNESDESQYEDN